MRSNLCARWQLVKSLLDSTDACWHEQSNWARVAPVRPGKQSQAPVSLLQLPCPEHSTDFCIPSCIFLTQRSVQPMFCWVYSEHSCNRHHLANQE